MTRCMGNPVMNESIPTRVSARRYVIHSGQKDRSMQHVRIKTVDGAWEDKEMDGERLSAWFKDNSKEMRAVTTDITLFCRCQLRRHEAGRRGGVGDVGYVTGPGPERVDPDGADFKNFKRTQSCCGRTITRGPAIGKILNPKVKEG